MWPFCQEVWSPLLSGQKSARYQGFIHLIGVIPVSLARWLQLSFRNFYIRKGNHGFHRHQRHILIVPLFSCKKERWWALWASTQVVVKWWKVAPNTAPKKFWDSRVNCLCTHNMDSPSHPSPQNIGKCLYVLCTDGPHLYDLAHCIPSLILKQPFSIFHPLPTRSSVMLLDCTYF